MSDLTTAMAKLDAAGLDETETSAVAEFLTAVLSVDDTDEAEVSGFGYEPKPKGLLLEISGIMKPPVKGWSWGMSQGFTATDDLAFTATDDLAR